MQHRQRSEMEQEGRVREDSGGFRRRQRRRREIGEREGEEGGEDQAQWLRVTSWNCRQIDQERWDWGEVSEMVGDQDVLLIQEVGVDTMYTLHTDQWKVITHNLEKQVCIAVRGRVTQITEPISGIPGDFPGTMVLIGGGLVVGNVYLPPGRNSGECRKWMDAIQSQIQRFQEENRRVIIGGDWNARHPGLKVSRGWGEQGEGLDRMNLDEGSNTYGLQLLGLLALMEAKTTTGSGGDSGCNTFFHYSGIGSSRPDHIIGSKAMWEGNLIVGTSVRSNTGVSDHYMVTCQVKLITPKWLGHSTTIGPKMGTKS